MRKAEAVQEVRELVAHYGPMLGLDNWLIYIEYTKDLDPDCIAMVHPTEGRTAAILEIGKRYRQLDEMGRRGAVLHELLHCVHHRLTEQTRVVARAAIDDDALYGALFAGVRNEAEFMVDSLSNALLGYLPLH